MDTAIPRSPGGARTRAATTVLPVLMIATAVYAAGPVAPPPAAAATGTAAAKTAAGSGSSRLSLGGKGLKALRAQRVKLSAVKPVRVSRTALVLPVSTGALAGTVRLDSRGALVLRKGRRRLRLASPQVRLAKKGSRITAKAGKRRITLFTVAPARGKSMRVNGAVGRATLQSARVTLTRSAGRTIRKALRLRKTPAGSFGTVTVIATIRPGTPGGGGGPPGGATPVGKPIPGTEPPELARPASAVDVTVNGITWDVRNSFIQYVNTEAAPGGGTYTAGGASGEPAEVRDGKPPLVYRFHYAPLRGWYHAASQTAALYYGGSVNFRYYGHGIDFDAKNPEIEINGTASRAIFRMDGRRSTQLGNKRGVLLEMEAGTTAGPRCAGTPVVTCTGIPARVPADAGQSVFAGFYQPGDAFGNISVTFTKP